MEFHYSKEKNVQIIVSLLKQYGIKKVVASPGSTNISLVESLQNDPYFEMYSVVDERSAAYIACGIAQESNEPVVLTCTAATASRNYVPALTEAYYRQLPVLAITSTTPIANIGHHQRQSMDRTTIQKDIANLSVLVRNIKDGLDEWDCVIQVNKALSELTHRGGGPVHINLETVYSMDFSVVELPPVRKITRIEQYQLISKPSIQQNRIAVFIGSNDHMTPSLIDSIDNFCETYNAICLIDHTSHYNGKYGINYALLGMQEFYRSQITNIDLLIHIGTVSGDDYTTCALQDSVKEVWRVSKDGAFVDTFKKLKYVFEMDENLFFKEYSSSSKVDCTYFTESYTEYQNAIACMPELPFSNLYVAKSLYQLMPQNSRIQLGILNSLRSWNVFRLDPSVKVYSNVGGFGIDGGVSSLVGSALCNKDIIYYGIFGDLQFFYDMNVLGLRHLPSNVRIILINNGKGNEFRNYHHPATIFGSETDKFIAAGGHFGCKSPNLVMHYAEDLGFKYLCASTVDEFESIKSEITCTTISINPVLIEIFTTTEDESEALRIARTYMVDKKDYAVRKLKDIGKSMLPEAVIGGLRKIIN